MMDQNWIDGIKYDGALRYYRPELLSQVKTFLTKKDAQEFCRQNQIKINRVTAVGSRFQKAFGIKDPHGRFLANN